MNKKGLRCLLNELTRISDFLGEATSFGSHLVDSAVAQCLQVIDQKLLDEDMFFKWIFKEPQIIVWLPTLYRLVSAKSIRHDVRCANCKSQVIIGLRYQCLQCLNYDLCQHCFFYGLTSRGHKISHPMQEYCYKSTRRDATRAALKTMANKLGLVYVKEGRSKGIFRRKYLRRRYMPHDPKMILEDTVIPEDDIIEEPITVEAMNLHPMVRQPNSVEEGCSSGFHSVSSSSQSPIDNVDGAASKTATPEFKIPKPVIKEKAGGDRKEQQNQLSSILQKMEEENAAVLERLTTLQNSKNKINSNLNSATDNHANPEKAVVEQNENDSGDAIKENAGPESPGQDQTTLMLSQPIDSCVAMQAQLDRLKLLMEGLFGCQDAGEKGCETPLRTKKQIMDQRQSLLLELHNSLTDPSLIESTPLVQNIKNYQNHLHSNSPANHQFQKKKLSRRALDSNFSPIVFQVIKLAYCGFCAISRFFSFLGRKQNGIYGEEVRGRGSSL